MKCDYTAFAHMLKDYSVFSFVPVVYNHLTGLVDWTSGLDWWTGLMDWTDGLV